MLKDRDCPVSWRENTIQTPSGTVCFLKNNLRIENQIYQATLVKQLGTVPASLSKSIAKVDWRLSSKKILKSNRALDECKTVSGTAVVENLIKSTWIHYAKKQSFHARQFCIYSVYQKDYYSFFFTFPWVASVLIWSCQRFRSFNCLQEVQQLQCKHQSFNSTPCPCSLGLCL